MNPLSLTPTASAASAALYSALSESPPARHGARTGVSRYQPHEGASEQQRRHLQAQRAICLIPSKSGDTVKSRPMNAWLASRQANSLGYFLVDEVDAVSASLDAGLAEYDKHAVADLEGATA